MKKKIPYLYPILFLCCFSILGQTKVWKKSNAFGKFQGYSVDKLDKNNSEIIALDFNAFKEQLSKAPLRNTVNNKTNTIINLPDEKGKLTSFKVFEAPVFSKSLSEKYTQIKSYVGFSTDDSGAIVRLSVSHKGVQTMISYKTKPTVFMQPIEGSITDYIVYNRLSKTNLPEEEFVCSTADEIIKDSNRENTILQRDANDQILRKFRLAISVNGEYTTYHGGTVANALAAINATMTRVNAVFETDMAITFEVQDFPELIYTDASTDPYSNSLSNWNVELQNTLTNTIGNAAYDIGHMFGGSGGGGNAGCIGCVCEDDTASTSDENKGAGITSPADGIPQGDNFDIDYVAHEIGHQMGALHTWSFASAGDLANIEPGSGSTIMGYAGITDSDIQPHSDPYFSYYSIKQITDNVTNTRTCWQANSPVNLTNNPPNTNAGNDFVIPSGTAYVLRGSATDADGGDNLMYCWEQNDDGVVTVSNFGPTLQSGAMARSLPPTASSDRYIPKLSRVVAGQLTETNPPDGGGDWETVSTVARDLNWALTVRDRVPSATGLGGQTSFDLMKVTVDATSGPFVVTSQTSNEMWDAGSTKTISWDVAGTNTGNVNTPTVNILLSLDGGVTFPYTLASNVSNDGSQSITVPVTGGGDTSTARIIVEGNNNIFYAMNSTNFSIQESEFSLSVTNSEVEVCSPSDAVYTFTYNTFLGFTGTTTFSASDLPTGAIATFSPATAVSDGTSVTATISGIGNVAQGAYNFNLVGTSGTISKSANVSLNTYNGTPENVTLISPTNGATEQSLTPTLTWDIDTNAASYDIEVATDSSFTTIIANENVTTNSYVASGFNQTSVYYWRVKAKNPCNEGDFSSIFSFTTLSCTACASSGNTEYNTSTTKVVFNTIDNTTTKLDQFGAMQGYFDYTSMSTTVKRGESHTLTIHVNTDGNYTTRTIVWVDWNQDCDFDDANEEYDLGEADNVEDGVTALSPLSITIPSTAALGSTLMRVSTRYENTSTSCQTDFDGEVEDYTVTVQDGVASLNNFSFSGFNLFPNPSKGTFRLNFDTVNTEKVSVQLLDLRGRLISKKDFFNTDAKFSEQIEFNKTTSGLYLVRITNGSKQITRKLVIE